MAFPEELGEARGPRQGGFSADAFPAPCLNLELGLRLCRITATLEGTLWVVFSRLGIWTLLARWDQREVALRALDRKRGEC